MASLWLLEAKAFPDDDRGEAARTVKFWLKPGTYSVGRTAGQADLDVIEDKSISRWLGLGWRRRRAGGRGGWWLAAGTSCRQRSKSQVPEAQPLACWALPAGAQAALHFF